MNSKKAQFLLLSAAMLVIAMFSVFQYFQSSTETSIILFQPSYSEDAINLFRAINDNNFWLIHEWYEFVNYTARKQIMERDSNQSTFTINVSCNNVTVTDSKNVDKTIDKNPIGESCEVSMSETEIGDYIYFMLSPTTNIINTVNITLGLLDSPIFYENSNMISKLCRHAVSLYKDRQVKLNCTVLISTD